ncbi:Oil body-associated protein 2A [Zea mays]|uniref:Oil body-associated protein 2A n=1 Tax=Zea mays TaxID=4577 RepID=A0A1D6NC77_MAIZE|nr:Oil body-associated protein 2A [Zea mays]
MASSDGKPLPTPASVGGGGGSSTAPPGQPTTVASKVLDMGAAAMQSLRPVKQAKQHMCTFALYAHDPKRQVETHHYVSRLNQDFLQCAARADVEAPARDEASRAVSVSRDQPVFYSGACVIKPNDPAGVSVRTREWHAFICFSVHDVQIGSTHVLWMRVYWMKWIGENRL